MNPEFPVSIDDSIDDVVDSYGEPSDRHARVVWHSLRNSGLRFLANSICMNDTSFDEILNDVDNIQVYKKAVEGVLVRDPFFFSDFCFVVTSFAEKYKWSPTYPEYKPHWLE
jgi:hypothetical protein